VDQHHSKHPHERERRVVENGVRDDVHHARLGRSAKHAQQAFAKRVWCEQRTPADEIHDEKPDGDRRRSKKPGDQAFANDAVPCAHGVSRLTHH